MNGINGIDKQRQGAEEERQKVSELRRVAELHQDAIARLAHVATQHERRLDYNEVVDVAMREDLRRIFAELDAIRERLEGPNGSALN